MAENLSIPFTFEFRKTQITWAKVNARMTGWARRTDGHVDGDYLTAQIAARGVIEPVRFSCHRLPEKWDGIWLQAYRDADVERVLEEFQPLLLVPVGKTYPDDESLRKNSLPASGKELRDDFLGLKPDVDNVVAFLERWGNWNGEPFIEISEIVRLQRSIMDALTESPQSWFATPYSLPSDLRRRNEFPYLGILTDRSELALRVTVTYDLVKGSKFRICARPDCGKPFEVPDKREKKYCTRDCSHLEAVRRSRRTERDKQPS
jgi:hypothetical protein